MDPYVLSLLTHCLETALLPVPLVSPALHEGHKERSLVGLDLCAGMSAPFSSADVRASASCLPLVAGRKLNLGEVSPRPCSP